MPSASCDILVRVPPEILFDVIADYERYPEFLPGLKSCRPKRTGDTVDVEFELDLGVKTIRYSLRHVEERPNRISWSLLKSDWMKVSSGSWDLFEDGEGTRARYQVEVQIIKPAFIPQALVDRVADELTRVQLPKTLEAFRVRAEAL